MDKRLAISLLTPLLMQCTHASFRYTGEFETQDGTARGRFTSIQNTTHYGKSIGCALTFWMYGGFCWGYMLVPSTLDKRTVRRNTEDALAHALGKPVHIPLSPIALEGWEKSPESVNYFLVKESSAPASGTANDNESRNAVEEPTPIEIPKKPMMERQKAAPLKLLLPFMTGMGLAYEWQSPWKFSLEAGGAAHITNTRGLFAEVKYPIASSNSEVLKLGLVGAQIEQRQQGWKREKYGYYLVERSAGIMMEMESDYLPPFQFLYFIDKSHYQIIDFVLNITYRINI
ncbi:hypothetical protein [Oligoflexus tunisiensis]|uniref:hypothetical protein n=1 Tax=Oligoflexus tunisiensis TaxID=708132 RepID=UPI00114D1156|nr:hypothetical protein [Oligoflexus tunisiensis]